MKRAYLVACLAILCAVIALVVAFQPRDAQAKTPSPATGYTIHIDAWKHFGAAHPSEVAHHWCKPVSKNLIQCLLYDADGPNGRLVGVENIVPTAVWKTFSPAERRLWHYHRWEIPRVHATTPDMTPAQSKALVASLMETYGKIVIIWDPMTSDQPIGQPTITILH